MVAIVKPESPELTKEAPVLATKPTEGAPQPQQTKPPSGGILKKIPSVKNSVWGIIIAGLVVVLAGAGTGYAIAQNRTGGVVSPGKTKVDETGEVTEAGVDDDEIYSEEAEGMLIEGGIDGEGTHYIDRDLGEAKYVYLTSTVVDLQSFVGKKVKVKGETVSSVKAGWLMDVGYIKLAD